MKNLTTESAEFHGVVDMKIVFSPCYSVYSVVFYSSLPRATSKRYSGAAARAVKKPGESACAARRPLGSKSASLRILNCGVFS